MPGKNILFIYYNDFLPIFIFSKIFSEKFRCNSTYMSSLNGMMFIFGGAVLVFWAFLIWTNEEVIWLILILSIVVVWGFYINYDVVRMVKNLKLK